MFPIDSTTGDYDQAMVDSFDALVRQALPWKLRDILPRVLSAGDRRRHPHGGGRQAAGPHRDLQPGIPLCPPEGDAGTGMAATNAVAERTGNVSAGTSVFAMIVLEKALSRVYPEIDMVTTPDGRPVAMVHCNNCTNEINAWARLFRQFPTPGPEVEITTPCSPPCLRPPSRASQDGGGLLLYNYLSGEPITGLEDGRPLFVRGPESDLSFANLMRTQLYSALATLKLGMDILSEEQVAVDRLLGHGGFFKTPVVGQRMMAAAANAPVAVMETAGEGGPWGMALLAAYADARPRARPWRTSWTPGLRRAEGVHCGASGRGRGRLHRLYGALQGGPGRGAGRGGTL